MAPSLHVLLFLMLPGMLLAQARLDNASFEGTPQDATTPVGWHPCAALTTPDILPGVWGVLLPASDGDTYVGLITRGDGSFESITQRLSQPLEKGECYQFRVDLAHSFTYAGYSKPLKVRIWGSRRKCDMDQLLLETERIEEDEWTTVQAQFDADKRINYILIEAFHNERRTGYEGNILIDNFSVIKPCTRASLRP